MRKAFPNNGKFVNISSKSGINNNAYGLGLCVGDINDDSYPDIYISNDFIACDQFYINDGEKFEDKINQLTKHVSYFGMGCDIADFNNDQKLDILQMDMAFSKHIESKKKMASMSTVDFWLTVAKGKHYQYMTNMLQLNNGGGTFSEIGHLSNIAKTEWSWGGLLQMDTNLMSETEI